MVDGDYDEYDHQGHDTSMTCVKGVSLCSTVATSYTQQCPTVVYWVVRFVYYCAHVYVCRLCTLTFLCECMYSSVCARFLCACACLALLTTLQRNEVISCKRPTQPLLRDGGGVKGRCGVCLVATINLLSVLSCHHRLCFALSVPSTQMCAFVEPVCVYIVQSFYRHVPFHPLFQLNSSDEFDILNK